MNLKDIDRKLGDMMKEEKIVNKHLDIPFKEFMPGQVIQSSQFNDDMLDIEDKVNEIVDKHNLNVNKLYEHLDDKENPHEVNPHQIGTYESSEIDSFIADVKSGNLNDEAIINRVLADACVDNRVIQDGSITVSKVDVDFGSQLDLENNISIVSRYTKDETDAIIQEKVGDGTYSKEQIDAKFEEYQAGTIVDGTIDVTKLKENVGELLDISNNSIFDNYVNNGYLIGTILPTLATKQDCQNTSEQLNTSINDVNNKVDNNYTILLNKLNDIQTNIASSHNHDNLYAKNSEAVISTRLTVDDIILTGRDIKINGKRALVGFSTEDGNKLVLNYDNDYANGVVINGTVSVGSEFYVNGKKPYLAHHENGYYGLCPPNNNTTDWVRTTKNGLIPYQSGGYSSIGTSAWQFNEGHFNTLNAHTLNLRKNGTISKINFASQTNDPGYIEHYESNNTSHLRFVVSDDNAHSDEIQFGVTPSGTYQNNVAFRGDGSSWFRGVADFGGSYISIGGRRIYIQSSQPSGARTGDVWFQI